MGIIFLMKGQYEKALETFQRFLRIAREAELPWYIADALCLLGTAYIKISPRFSELALEYHAQAAQAMKAPSGVMLGGTDWIERGDCALEVGDLERAKEYYENALTIPTITSNLEKPRLLVRIASVSIIENDLEKAGQLISEARIFVEKHDLKFHVPLVILRDAELASRLEHWQAAHGSLHSCGAIR